MIGTRTALKRLPKILETLNKNTQYLHLGVLTVWKNRASALRTRGQKKAQLEQANSFIFIDLKEKKETDFDDLMDGVK
jgi:hypothetical protein